MDDRRKPAVRLRPGADSTDSSTRARLLRAVYCALSSLALAAAAACSRPEPGHPYPVSPPVDSSRAVAATTPTNLQGSSEIAKVDAAPPLPSGSRRPCRLLAAGDSLTDPRSGGGGYLELAQRSCGCEVTNLGQGGAMVNQIRRRLLAHLEASGELYTHAVIFGGVNDLYSDLTAKRTVAKISADLDAMYRASKRHGLRVVALTVAPWGGFKRYFTDQRWTHTLELNAWIRQSPSRDSSDAVVDAESLLACGDPRFLCASYAAPYRDGLHFGPRGHRQLAVALVRALGPTFCPELPDDGSS